jgi:hypothetical protein
VAEDLFAWADSMKSRGVEVRVNPAGEEAIIAVPRVGRPFKVMLPHDVRVSLGAVVKKGEPWDERTKQLVQGLDEIGVRLGEDDRPRAPLELLADDGTRATFKALMKQHLENLTG